MRSFKKRIENYHLKEYVKIVSGVIQNAFEYWKISDVFIRPTTTDIEGISVKEGFVGKYSCYSK